MEMQSPFNRSQETIKVLNQAMWLKRTSEADGNLAVFELELPDRYHELFCQHLKSFPLFSKIPLEIRLMIWREALPAGRRFRVHLDTPASGLTGPTYRLVAPPPPALSQVSYESRHEILKHYTILHTPSRKASIHAVTTPPSSSPSFFNPNRDVLQLVFGAITAYDDPPPKLFCNGDVEAWTLLAASASRLELRADNYSEDWYFDSMPREVDTYRIVFAKFTSLSELTLLVPPEDEGDMRWPEEFLDYVLAKRERTGKTFCVPVIGCRRK